LIKYRREEIMQEELKEKMKKGLKETVEEIEVFKDNLKTDEAKKIAESIQDILASEEVKGVAKSIKEFKDTVTKDKVNEGVVVVTVFDLYLDLYRADMTGPVIKACYALLDNFDVEIRKWAEKNKVNLLEEHLAPIRTRRLQLANVESALKLKWAETSYRPPRELKSIFDVMADLEWFKRLKEDGFDTQLTWKKVFDFLVGYKLDKTVTVQGGAIFGGDPQPIGLLADLRLLFTNYFKKKLDKELKGPVETWKDLHREVLNFNDKKDWDKPKEYGELNKKLLKLYKEMQAERKVFEKYLRKELNLTQLSARVAELEKQMGKS
jgi:hypothetical protein